MLVWIIQELSFSRALTSTRIGEVHQRRFTAWTPFIKETDWDELFQHWSVTSLPKFSVPGLKTYIDIRLLAIIEQILLLFCCVIANCTKRVLAPVQSNIVVCRYIPSCRGESAECRNSYNAKRGNFCPPHDSRIIKEAS